MWFIKPSPLGWAKGSWLVGLCALRAKGAWSFLAWGNALGFLSTKDQALKARLLFYYTNRWLAHTG